MVSMRVLALARRFAVLLVFVTTFLVAGHVVVPATAHYGSGACTSKYHDGINRGVACNRYAGFGNHYANWIDGCDRHSDGWRVRAWGNVVGAPAIPGDWDPNGNNEGCANDQLWGHLENHRICVEVAGCSGWQPHGWP